MNFTILTIYVYNSAELSTRTCWAPVAAPNGDVGPVAR